MYQSISGLLQRCTVRLSLSKGGFGTGFFVAPGWILTCAHVVSKAGDNPVDVLWKNEKKDGSIEEKLLQSKVIFQFSEGCDLAFLQLVEMIPHPCVYLDSATLQLDDPCYIFGYPRDALEDYSRGDSVTLRYEGDSDNEKNGLLLKLKDGQIKTGFSGSPLLNLRTGGVVGIVTTSRNVITDLGGRAIPVNAFYPSPNLRGLQLEQRKQILEIIEGNRKAYKYSKTWRKVLRRNLNARRTSFAVALASILGLIYILLETPEDLIILSFARFLIAVGFGYAIFLLLKTLDLTKNNFRGIPIHSLGSFITVLGFIAVSFILIPHKPLFIRNLTGTSEYPVLGMVNDEFPKPLSQFLNLRAPPIIDTSSPVYEAIQTFKEESGNGNLLSEKYSEKENPGISAVLNDKNYTVAQTLSGRGAGKKEKNSQNQKDFEKDTVSYDGERQEFGYSSARSALQIGLDDLSWTSTMREIGSTAKFSFSSFSFLQYPKLSSALSYAEDFPDSFTKNDWMKQALQIYGMRV